MKVLIDVHHAGLAESLHLLFEDRLGHEVYVPHGLDWYEHDYWIHGRGALYFEDGRWVRDDTRLARQHLMVGESHPQYPERKFRRVTLDEFRSFDDWGFIVASVPDNERGYALLAKQVGAKYVLSVGNTSQAVDWSLDPLALVSSEMPIQGRGVRVHQEFDSDGLFGFRVSPRWFGRDDPLVQKYGLKVADGPPRLASFVNCFSSMGSCHAAFAEAEERLPEATLLEFGIDGRDGVMEPVSILSALMGEADFGWHDKVHGDGFGHVIHGWAAIGRPLIGHASHYRGKMAEPFWEDGVTAIDLDRHSVTETVQLIREIAADSVRHERMCRAIRQRFDELVDYSAEAEQIRALLS